MPLAPMRAQYIEVLESVRAVIAAAAHDLPGEPLLRARRTLSQALVRGVALRETLLIAPLRASPLAEHRDAARALVDRALQSQLRTIEFNAQWSMATIRRDLAGYRSELTATLSEAEARIAEELRTLHPMVLAAMNARTQVEESKRAFANRG